VNGMGDCILEGRFLLANAGAANDARKSPEIQSSSATPHSRRIIHLIYGRSPLGTSPTIVAGNRVKLMRPHQFSW
jgi:hypothetical protein